MNPLLLHINYFEQGQSTERACKLARELGADGIEFRRKPSNWKGTDLEYLDEVSRALDAHPLDYVSFGAPGINLMSCDRDERERELEAAEAFYRKAASRFPLKVVNTFAGNLMNKSKAVPYLEYWHHGSAIASEEQWQNAIEGFKRMGKVAEELGFRFAFETHGVYLHDTLEATMRLVEGVDSEHVGMLWDHANMMLFPECPGFDEVLSRAKSKLYHVHLKNLLVPPSRFLAVCGLADGVINIRQQVAKLLEAGYDGPICIESPREGDREWFAREDMAYLRDVLGRY